MADEYSLVQGAPDLYAIALAPKEADGDLLGMLALINLSEDDAADARIYLPPHLRAAKEVLTVGRDGSLASLAHKREADGLRLCAALLGCTPTYIVLKK